MDVFGHLYNGRPIALDGFAFDRAELPAGSGPLLHRVAQTCTGLRRFFPAGRLFITGHADRPGTADRNLDLGRRRADRVAHELQHGGLPSNAMSTISLGEFDPVEDVPGRSGRNRRVELLFQRQPTQFFRIPPPAVPRSPTLSASTFMQPVPWGLLPNPCRIPGLCTIDDFTREVPPRSSPNFRRFVDNTIDRFLQRSGIPRQVGGFRLREALRNAIRQPLDQGWRAAIHAALEASGFSAYEDAVDGLIDALGNPEGDGMPDEDPALPRSSRPLIDR